MLAGLPLMKTILTPLTKNVLTGLTTVSPATDSVIQKNIFGLGLTALIISNEEMNDIMNIVKYLEESGKMIQGVS